MNIIGNFGILWIKPSYDAKVPQATEQNRVQRCPMSINIHTLKTRQRSGCWLPPDPLCGCCVFCGIVLCLLWHISCRISEPKKARQFFLAPKTSQLFLATCLQNKFLATCQQSQILLATFFMQRACGANCPNPKKQPIFPCIKKASQFFLATCLQSQFLHASCLQSMHRAYKASANEPQIHSLPEIQQRSFK